MSPLMASPTNQDQTRVAQNHQLPLLLQIKMEPIVARSILETRREIVAMIVGSAF